MTILLLRIVLFCFFLSYILYISAAKLLIFFIIKVFSALFEHFTRLQIVQSAPQYFRIATNRYYMQKKGEIIGGLPVY